MTCPLDSCPNSSPLTMYALDCLRCHVLIHVQINRFGINSQTSVITYDPVQSLLAVGTNDTKFGVGQIYIFGQKRVNAVLALQRKASVRILQFCSDKLICFDSRNDLTIFSLETKRIISSYSPPGTVLSVCSDPTLDYILLGMQTGNLKLSCLFETNVDLSR